MNFSFVSTPAIHHQWTGVENRRKCARVTSSYRGLMMASGPNLLSQSFSRRHLLQRVSIAAAMLPLQTLAAAPEETKPEKSEEKPLSDIDPRTAEPDITDRVFLDISVAGQASHRLVIGLYGSLTPKTVDNFKKLAVNGYANTLIYRIVPGLTIQMGDVLGDRGKSGRPAIEDGQPFAPDNFRVMHTTPGIVSMVRRPDGLVDSRFFIATREGDSMYLDGRYVGFGRVVEGMDFVKEIEKAGGEGFIRRPVRIVSSGVLE